MEALPWALAPSPGEEVRWFASALEAASFYGERLLFPPLSGEEAEAVRARMRRVRKTLHRLEREEAALREKADLRNTALALQAALYRLETNIKLHEVDLGPVGGRVELDPSLSVVQNMERWFHLAAKAERGLGAVRQRRELLEEELAGLAAGMRVPESRAPRPKAVTRGKASRPELPVHRFRTADGFLVLRGKNAAANHRLVTRAAAPFDLWFHAADGPGAHCVLKRDHPAQEVPERSLVQAAVLAGLKSWQSEGGKAEVLCALIRDVRAVKGAAMGQVVVDAVLRSLRVELDPSLEQKLRID